MQTAKLNGISVHYKLEGPEDGAPVVFANSLGTDFRMWDPLISHLPEGLRILRYDKRGHGLSEGPEAPYKMGTLVSDAEALMDHVGMKNALFVGLSIGGLIAQGLATKRLDLVRTMVLSNTAARIGNQQMWQSRIDAIEAGGMAAIGEATMERWFSKAFRNSDAVHPWRNMLERQVPQGYIGCAHGIAGADFITPTSGLRLPVLGIAGNEDGATPPDLVRETIDLIPGARFALMRGVGHLPCIEDPEGYGALLRAFMQETGHLAA